MKQTAVSVENSSASVFLLFFDEFLRTYLNGDLPGLE